MQFRILKRIATSSFLAVLVFTKSISGRVLPGLRWGGLQHSPDPLAILRGPYF